MISKLRRRGRTLRFSLPESARVAIRLRRGTSRARVLRRRSLAAGSQSVRLPRLRAGRYRLSATATDPAGNRSPARALHFTIRARS